METSVPLLERLVGTPTDDDWRRLLTLFSPKDEPLPKLAQLIGRARARWEVPERKEPSKGAQNRARVRPTNNLNSSMNHGDREYSFAVFPFPHTRNSP
jgi:hypothetical protein